MTKRRSDPVTQLGFATQLATVRAIGAFLSDPSAVPAPVVAALAGQLEISDPSVLATYAGMPVRWRHTAEIQAALDHLAAGGYPIAPADLARLAPLGHPTINLDGRYRPTSRPPAAGLRPLRTG